MQALGLAATEAGCGPKQTQPCLAPVSRATAISEGRMGCGWPCEHAQVRVARGEPRHVASEVSMGSWERTCRPQERTSCLRSLFLQQEPAAQI